MIFDANTNKPINFFFRQISREEIKNNKYTPNGGWAFDWVKPLTNSFSVFGLVLEGNPSEVQGLIALKLNQDTDYLCVDIEIIESAPHNKKNSGSKPNANRKYKGIGKCLVAFACQYSLDNGLEGYVSLTSKSSKIPFYTSSDLGGTNIYGNNIIFDSNNAKRLSSMYFQGGIQWVK